MGFYLVLFILQQGLDTESVDAAHLLIGVLVGVEHARAVDEDAAALVITPGRRERVAAGQQPDRRQKIIDDANNTDDHNERPTLCR